MKLGTQVGLGPGHVVLDGDPSPSSTKGHSPQFLVHICCCQMAGWIKMPRGMEVGLGPGDFVLDEDPALPSPKRGGASSIFAHVYCGQTAGWIKMAPGTEVGLGRSHIVHDGDPAPTQKRGGRARPIFGPWPLWPNGWMDSDATWYAGRPRPTRHCIRWGPSSPPQKGTEPRQFSAHVYCGHGRSSQLLLSTCYFSNNFVKSNRF